MYKFVLVHHEDEKLFPLPPNGATVSVVAASKMTVAIANQADALLLFRPDLSPEPFQALAAQLDTEYIQTFIFVYGTPPPGSLSNLTVVTYLPPALDIANTLQIIANILEHSPVSRTQAYLQDIVHNANQSIYHTSAIDYMLDSLQRLVPYDGANICTFDAEYALVRYARGYDDADTSTLDNMRIPLGTPNFQHILKTGEPMLIPNTENSQYWDPWENHDWIRGWMGIPIKKNNIIIGILNLDSKTPHQFKPYHVQRLLRVSDHIAMMLENTQLYEMINEYSGLLSVMNRQNAMLHTPFAKYDSVSEMCQHVAETVVHAYDKADCGVLLVDKTRHVLVREARAGTYTVRAEGEIPLDGPGLVPEAVRQGKVIYAPHVQRDARYIASEPNTRSELVIPLKTRRGVLGVLDLQHQQVKAFSVREQEGLKVFADYIAQAIENLQSYETQRSYTHDLEARVQERTRELEQANQRLEAILHHASEAIVLLRADATVEQANRAFRDLLHVDPIEFVGQPFASFIAPGDQRTYAENLTWIENNLVPISFEVTLQHQREQQTYTAQAEITLSPTSVNNGELETTVCTVRDITRHREMEANLRRTLESERELSHLKTQFIRTVHHQFITPLATILSSSELIRMYLKPQREALPEKTTLAIDKHFDKVMAEVRNMEKMLSEVRFMSQVGNDTLDFLPEQTNIFTLTEEVIANFQKQQSRHQVKLHTEGDRPTLRIDVKLVREALRQLLSNAVKYSPDATDVHVYLTMEAADVHIGVQDRGIGIPQDEMDQVFAPFFRGRQADTIQGAGLGLSIVKQTAHLHGGTVDVRSNPQDGTRFTLKLPR